MRPKIIVVLCVLALAGACGADDGDTASSLVGRPAQETAGQAPGDQPTLGQPAPATGGQATAQPAGRDVVYTAALRVSAGDLTAASQEAEAIAARAGGFLFRQDSDLAGTEKATLVFKVPPDRFQQVLGDLGRLGRVVDRSVQAEDVTDQVVDVEGRLSAAKASAERLRGFLAQARNLTEVTSVEAELAKREAEVESLEGRRRVLQSRVDLATVTVQLVERSAAEPSDDLPSFLQGLRGGWVSLVTVGQVVLAAAGFLTPFLPLALVGFLILRRYLRRRRLRRPPGSGGEPTAQPWPAPSTPPASAEQT